MGAERHGRELRGEPLQPAVDAETVKVAQSRSVFLVLHLTDGDLTSERRLKFEVGPYLDPGALAVAAGIQDGARQVIVEIIGAGLDEEGDVRRNGVGSAAVEVGFRYIAESVGRSIEIVVDRSDIGFE